MDFPEGVLRQRNDVQGIKASSHDLGQTSQLSIKGLRVHQAKSDGGQSTGFGNPGGKLRDIRDPGHRPLDKGIFGSHLCGYRAIQKAILFHLSQVAQAANLRHEGLHSLLGSRPKTLGEGRRKGGLHPQRDQLIRGQIALKRVDGPGTHSAREGTAAFLRDLCAAQRALVASDLLEGDRVSFVEKATGNLQVEADQIARIQAEVGEPPALEVIDGNQICQPMEALEDNPGGPGGE